MCFWKYMIFNEKGDLIRQDIGFETEEDAEREALEWVQDHRGKG